MKDSLLPVGVELIQTAPGQAFFAQIYVAALLGIIISIPLLIRELYEFIVPAIEENEKKNQLSENVNSYFRIIYYGLYIFIFTCNSIYT